MRPLSVDIRTADTSSSSTGAGAGAAAAARFRAFKSLFDVNKTLVPLKLIIFFYYSAAFCVLPYLTIHMKDIGIPVDHIAVIYAILPFTVFASSPMVGFLADKLGSFTRTLAFTLIGSGLFHTALLLLPAVSQVPAAGVPKPPGSDLTFSMQGNLANISWEPCSTARGATGQAEQAALQVLFPPADLDLDLQLQSCRLDSCPELGPCGAFSRKDACSVSREGEATLSSVRLIPHPPQAARLVPDQRVQKGNWTWARASDGWIGVALLLQAEGSPAATVGLMETSPAGCRLTCTLVVPLNTEVVASGKFLDGACGGGGDQPEESAGSGGGGNLVLTVGLYFVFRSLATMCLGCNFCLIDAQTIQMCAEEESQGRSGALGRQFVFQAVAQAIISPLVGKLMDVVGAGGLNYVVPFVAHDVFLVATVLMLLFADLTVHLPKSPGFSGLGEIFRNVDVVVFLTVMFVSGSLWGFVESFLFVYLKDDMGAPMYLLGLTVTVGAAVSVPFLYVSDWLVDKVGRPNIFLGALAAYSVRYFGYSYITDPWMAFPFEAMELFTLQLFKVAFSQYVGQSAPKGLLATLNGLSGGLHYGVGKGAGSLLGGFLITLTGDTALAFRIFGVFAAVSGFAYFFYEYGCSRRCRSSDSILSEATTTAATAKGAADAEMPLRQTPEDDEGHRRAFLAADNLAEVKASTSPLDIKYRQERGGSGRVG